MQQFQQQLRLQSIRHLSNKMFNYFCFPFIMHLTDSDVLVQLSCLSKSAFLLLHWRQFPWQPYGPWILFAKERFSTHRLLFLIQKDWRNTGVGWGREPTPINLLICDVIGPVESSRLCAGIYEANAYDSISDHLAEYLGTFLSHTKLGSKFDE